MEKKTKAVNMKLDARRTLILTEVAKGTRYTDMVEKFSKEWNLAKSTTVELISETLKYMRSQATKDNLIAMNMERLDSIISDSIKEKDRKSAIKAIDTQNKLAGGYEEKIKLETDTEVNLIFDV
jgi:hypothetical protein